MSNIRYIHTFFSAFAALSLLFSCKSGNARFSGETEGDTIPVNHAVNLRMIDYGNFTEVAIRNPWDTTRTLHTYLLVPADSAIPHNLPEGTVIRTPLRSSVIYSSVHNSLVDELGAGNAITGICDVQYIHRPALTRRIADGDIADCGNSMSPNIERIIDINPGAILLSPFENSNGYGKLAQIGVPIVECADYMETSPLGRAEWMKFYGRLFGKASVADSVFKSTESDYLKVKELASKVTGRPKVLMDRIFGAVWNVPGAYSTIGRFIEDAGGENIFNEYKISGSTPLAPEQVLYKASDADLWLIRYSQNSDVTMHQLGDDNAIYRKFKPFNERKVFGSNTMKSNFYEETPFHPQWLLSDFIAIFHPELSGDTTTRYFTPIK